MMTAPARCPGMRSGLLLPLVLACLLGVMPPAAADEEDDERRYSAEFHAELVPAEGVAHTRLVIGQPDRRVRELRFRIDAERHDGFEADGELEVSPPFVYWRPPAGGGSFRMRVVVDRERGGGGLDAHINDNWAILRLDHLFPAVRVRTVAGAASDSRLTLSGPEGWSFETRYGAFDGDPLAVDTAGRRFSRPTGWIAAGHLGVRRERVADRSIAVAAPVEQGVRRLDHLALINWTLPELLAVFPQFPERVLVVSAGDPMWRGALSGPDSLYIHAERPLINERGTSTLLHELIHVAGIVHTGPGAGWIVEGLADWYSLELLARSGAISDSRLRRSRTTLERRGRGAEHLDTRSAGGATISRAVGALYGIDAAIREATGDSRSLDDVARRLAESGEPVTVTRLRWLAEETAGRTLDVFDTLPLKRPPAPFQFDYAPPDTLDEPTDRMEEADANDTPPGADHGAVDVPERSGTR